MGPKSKISSVLDSSGSLVNKVSSGSEIRVCDVNLTPLSKVATGSGLDFRENEKEIDVDDDEKLSIPSGNENKTPPIQASVSPEIQTQCGSSIVATATTPACYAAGYVVSGVTDKRKCRPRGILTVGEDNDISGFDEDDDSNKENVLGVVDNSSTVSMLPLPAEASMHWLLSPCNEEDEDHKENSEIGSWNLSQSQMRISWRDGLVSRIFEMDEFDSCRYLSDEEEDASEYYNEQLKSCQNPEFNVDEGKYEILKNGFGSAEFVDTELKTGEKSEERLPSQLSCSCAESISTDGGGLTASGDSDWTLCYKNQLFKV
ncbi:hypothetical protein Patl1_27052 [Pistacia atlantica]|uniref:Uncharacterized protein n=1 Tax=Pistacia atlantica TaxID=434234 RepID=A0ACC1B126_9ROSI|nr:hypothetical protein Patl1_27052 [Pistacia atlantica]